MKRFKSLCVNAKGAEVKKSIFAKNLHQASHKLEKAGYIVLDIQEIKSFLDINLEGLDENLASMFWQLGYLNDSTIGYAKSIELIKNNISNLKVKKLLEDMANSIDMGLPLSDGLRKNPSICPDFICSLFEIGEQSGNLKQMCEICASEIESKKEFSGKIKKALFYPSVMLVAVSITLIAISAFVLPEFIILFNEFEANLPLATKMLIAFSNFINNYFIFIAFIFSLIILALILLRNFNRYYFDYLIYTIPVARRLILYHHLYTYFLGLSYFLQSSIPFSKSVEQNAQFCSNLFLRRKLSFVGECLEDGLALSTAFEKMDIEILNIALIKSAELSGKLDVALSLNARFYKKKYLNLLQNLQSLIEPSANILIGIVVGFITIAIISPVWNLIATI